MKKIDGIEKPPYNIDLIRYIIKLYQWKECTENCLNIYVCIKDTHSPITNTDAVDLSSLALHYANL